MFDGYLNFASQNTFACGPIRINSAWHMHKDMFSLLVVSKLNENYFSSRNIDLYKWWVFKAVQCNLQNITSTKNRDSVLDITCKTNYEMLLNVS